MTTGYKFLLPQPDAETKGWWDALKRHELVLQRCAGCKTFRHPPQMTCSNCYSEKSEWVKVSGRGTLYSYCVVYQSVLPQWKDAVPFNIAFVTPEEAPGIRIIGNVVGTDNSQLKVGMPLQVAFDDVTPTDTIPRWRPR